MLTWLHFSDLHLCPPRTGWQARPAMDKMLQDLHSLQDRYDLRPDLIFFTGDAAFGNFGTEPGGRISDQFALFGSFLETLLATFHPPLSKEQLFLVPGNHDVDRSVLLEDTRYLDGRSLTDVERLFQEGGPRLEIYMRGLEAYREFLRDFGLVHLLQDRERLTYGFLLKFAGSRIGVGGFNTAWNTGGRSRDGFGDRGRMWVAGSWQLGKIRPLLADADVRIALIHHSSSWLRAEEDPTFWRDLKKDFHFVLHGHQHDGWIESADQEAVVVSASANFQLGERGYNIVQIDPASLRGSAWLRAWDEKGGGWIPFLINNRTDERGVWPLRGQGSATHDSQITAESYQRKVKDLLQPLRGVLRTKVVQDFRYFSSALDGLAEAIDSFILWVKTRLSGMDPATRYQALKTAQSFLDLPVYTEKTERLTEQILREESTNQNARQFQIVLLEYAERFTAPLGNLIELLEGEASDAASTAGRENSFTKALLQLVEESGVARFQGLLSLLRIFRGRLLKALDPTTKSSHLTGKVSHSDLLDAFWGSFDLVLTEERFSQKDATEVVASLLADDSSVSVRKMLVVLRVLYSVRLGANAIQKLKDDLAELAELPSQRERDLKVALRVLTLHQARYEVRRAAVRQLDDDSAWRLLSMSQYPRNSANEIAEWILEREDTLDRHRILFDLQHDDFMRAITRRNAEDIIEIQKFMLLFKSSAIMFEERYYLKYRQLLNAVVESLKNKLSLDKEILDIYSSLETFDSANVCTARDASLKIEALAGLDELAFRKLLREPIYFFTIIKHPEKIVWVKVLQNLDMTGVVAQCLRSPGIDPHLFDAIFGKVSVTFKDPYLGKLWALNPNAGRTLSRGEWILQALPTRVLQEIADAKQAASNVRWKAREILKTRPDDPASEWT